MQSSSSVSFPEPESESELESVKVLQERGFSVLSIPEEATPELHVPSPVLHEGLAISRGFP